MGEERGRGREGEHARERQRVEGALHRAILNLQDSDTDLTYFKKTHTQ